MSKQTIIITIIVVFVVAVWIAMHRIVSIIQKQEEKNNPFGSDYDPDDDYHI